VLRFSTLIYFLIGKRIYIVGNLRGEEDGFTLTVKNSICCLIFIFYEFYYCLALELKISSYIREINMMF